MPREASRGPPTTPGATLALAVPIAAVAQPAASRSGIRRNARVRTGLLSAITVADVNSTWSFCRVLEPDWESPGRSMRFKHGQLEIVSLAPNRAVTPWPECPPLDARA